MIILDRVDIAVTTLFLIISSYFYFIKRRSTINTLRGPPSPSFLLGFDHDLRSKRVDKVLLKWSEEYGTAYKLPGCFGESTLIISDPKAIHRILQESLNNYPESPDFRKFVETLFGKSLIWAHGEDHKRHRRVLSSAFSISHVRQLLPLFQNHVNKLSEKWDNILQGNSQTINIFPWLQNITLDIIGESAFNYHFDALNDKPSELSKTLHELEYEICYLAWTPQAVARYIPDGVISWQSQRFPIYAEKIAKQYQEQSYEKAKEVLREAGVDLSHFGENDEVPIGTGTEKNFLSVLGWLCSIWAIYDFQKS
ncbi:cytochrome P450 [Marasmius fiardii PR-910]|nr:cytochrome P450 [Marasmius fiardii PR-910]